MDTVYYENIQRVKSENAGFTRSSFHPIPFLHFLPLLDKNTSAVLAPMNRILNTFTCTKEDKKEGEKGLTKVSVAAQELLISLQPLGLIEDALSRHPLDPLASTRATRQESLPF